MPSDSAEILAILDEACEASKFPVLDNGYVYLAATRMSLFRSPMDWALVIEVFGFSPRAGLPDTHIVTFASQLHNRKTADDYISDVAYQRYLENNPNNESRFVHPIEEGLWMDPDWPEDVALSGTVRLRDIDVSLPSVDEYKRHGIKLKNARPAVFEFARYLAATHRDKVLATPDERRGNVLPEMTQILQLEEWCHPDVCSGDLPSWCETFQQLADVLVTGDVSKYKPSGKPNTHWTKWPEGGLL